MKNLKFKKIFTLWLRWSLLLMIIQLIIFGFLSNWSFGEILILGKIRDPIFDMIFTSLVFIPYTILFLALAEENAESGILYFTMIVAMAIAWILGFF